MERRKGAGCPVPEEGQPCSLHECHEKLEHSHDHEEESLEASLEERTNGIRGQNSPNFEKSLLHANVIIRRLRLASGLRFIPLGPDDFFFRLAFYMNFEPLTVVHASHFFDRILLSADSIVPEASAYLESTLNDDRRILAATCLNIAGKFLGEVAYTTISVVRPFFRSITPLEALDMELVVLDALDWRLYHSIS